MKLLIFLIIMPLSVMAKDQNSCQVFVEASFPIEIRDQVVPLTRSIVLDELLEDWPNGDWLDISVEEYDLIVKTLKEDFNSEVYTLRETGEIGGYLLVTDSRCQIIFSGFIYYV